MLSCLVASYVCECIEDCIASWVGFWVFAATVRLGKTGEIEVRLSQC